MNVIKIIMADDHEIFRQGFQVLLQGQEELQLVAEAENGRELIELVDKHKPQLVFTDIKMPLMDGVEATTQLGKKYPQLGIIALSMFNDDHLIMDMLRAGARGYLLKNTNKAELLQAAKAVHDGEKYFCNATSRRLAEMIAKSEFNPYRNPSKENLTEREMDIIRLICSQLSNKEIADELSLSIRTIETHRENIMKKIGARNTIGIVLYAIRHRIITV